MIRMGVASHVTGNLTETNEHVNSTTRKLSLVTLADLNGTASFIEVRRVVGDSLPILH